VATSPATPRQASARRHAHALLTIRASPESHLPPTSCLPLATHVLALSSTQVVAPSTTHVVAPSTTHAFALLMTHVRMLSETQAPRTVRPSPTDRALPTVHLSGTIRPLRMARTYLATFSMRLCTATPTTRSRSATPTTNLARQRLRRAYELSVLQYGRDRDRRRRACAHQFLRRGCA
jgi:hypothetical protein